MRLSLLFPEEGGCGWPGAPPPLPPQLAPCTRNSPGSVSGGGSRAFHLGSRRGAGNWGTGSCWPAGPRRPSLPSPPAVQPGAVTGAPGGGCPRRCPLPPAPGAVGPPATPSAGPSLTAATPGGDLPLAPPAGAAGAAREASSAAGALVPAPAPPAAPPSPRPGPPPPLLLRLLLPLLLPHWAGPPRALRREPRARLWQSSWPSSWAARCRPRAPLPRRRWVRAACAGRGRGRGRACAVSATGPCAVRVRVRGAGP